MKYHQIEWPYLTYKDNQLYNEDGTLFSQVYFTNVGQAEAWLVEKDIRGTIR